MLELLNEFDFSNNAVDFTVCFESLSCWKTHSSGRSSFATAACKCLFSISRYITAFILQSITGIFLIPFAEKHLQTKMLPSPNFTVRIVLFGARAVPSFLQTWSLELRPNNSIFISSDHRTLSQNDSCSVIWSEANFSRATLCRLVKSGVFLGERDFSSLLWRSLLIVRNVTLGE